MKYSNAYNGIKKVFTAEILTLIGTIVLVLSAALIAGSDAVEGDKETLTMIAGVIGLIGLILLLISTLKNLSGLNQAALDDPAFKKAFFCAALILLANVLSTIFGSKDIAILNALPQLLSILLFYFTITGISNLARNLNRLDMSSFGTKILILEVVLLAVSFILQLLPGDGSFRDILAIVASSMEIIVYIVYLIYLAKAKRMLAGK